MAGYVLKVILENTHPPVWRRIIIPERITFSDLHEMIQILFDWDDCHLHEFSIPSKDICIDNEDEPWACYHYAEDETLVDSFLPGNKWVRYTYDFGDTWRHKILYEKTDQNYDKRYVTLLKVKGDHFLEDSGGVWESFGDEGNRCSPDPTGIQRRLNRQVCPEHEEMDHPEAEELSEAEFENITKNFFRAVFENVDMASLRDYAAKTPSKMDKKID